jgi:hypothetical protein
MTHRFLFAPLAIAASLTAAAQTAPAPSKAPAPKTAKTWTQPKTPWGDPDLQGVWPGTDMVGTPLQRDPKLGTRAFLTEQEFEQRVARARQQEEIDEQEVVNDITRCDPSRGTLGNREGSCKDGVSIGPPLYWDDRGKPNKQASLVVDPPDGRIPPLTPAAQKMVAEIEAANRPYAATRGKADSPEDRSIWERCITRGPLGSILPATYNDGNQILQVPGYVIIRNEMIHETRVVPLDGRPHVGPAIRNYMGDSRGHWEGNTLVVETTNFKDKTLLGGTPASDELRMVERIARTGASTLNYEVTITDPKTWTKPWKVSFPLKNDPVYVLYEYACHEGNYAMYNALTGARAQEKAAAAAKK